MRFCYLVVFWRVAFVVCVVAVFVGVLCQSRFPQFCVNCDFSKYIWIPSTRLQCEQSRSLFLITSTMSFLYNTVVLKGMCTNIWKSSQIASVANYWTDFSLATSDEIFRIGVMLMKFPSILSLRNIIPFVDTA